MDVMSISVELNLTHSKEVLISRTTHPEPGSGQAVIGDRDGDGGLKMCYLKKKKKKRYLSLKFNL